jgi:orc1/cdc6 family replication initiation protein
MITDARVLQPEFIPKEVVHRDAEVNHLSGAFDPVTRGEPAETAMLFGPSGVGKTCIAKFTLDRLRETVLDVNHQYINCWQNYTRFRVLYRILEGVGRTVDVHRQSTPKDELLERVHEYDGPPYVVVLDEVDQLQDKRLLYDLYRTRGISMVLVANRETELFSQLDDRLTSRLHGSTRIHFDKYGLDELVSILADRIRWGLSEGVVGTDQLGRIADAAAGDARVAISILRNAARQAEREGASRISHAAVTAAIPEARAELRQKSVEQLTPDQQTLYDVVVEAGEITPGELYERYERRVDDPKTKRTVRNYLSKLAQYNLVRAEGERRGRTYHPVE